ncbi:amino acid synthesis family protein [Rhizobium sp. 2MFCol3.1]|uniref:amino acid synthesis family protein n=1 Tax=Rhizobium sp. 2MFCol3.1 TaxID=1246459 RepID=UPI00047712BA|nr:amino acid synthesis family protein [Rhizobium sp. 2MFCol3.1]
MPLILRKTLLQVETTYIEGDRAVGSPLSLYSAIAVLKNPWAGRGFVEDLSPEITEIAPQLGRILTDLIIDAVGNGKLVESYGKAAVVGMSGEVEHASALIHTLQFGNVFRSAVGATTYLTFTNTRGGANSPIVIPMVHTKESGKRSHYLTIQTALPDAPAHDEIVVALGASTGGRPHHRIGDRYEDLKILGNSAENPAGVEASTK